MQQWNTLNSLEQSLTLTQVYGLTHIHIHLGLTRTKKTQRGKPLAARLDIAGGTSHGETACGGQNPTRQYNDDERTMRSMIDELKNGEHDKLIEARDRRTPAAMQSSLHEMTL